MPSIIYMPRYSYSAGLPSSARQISRAILSTAFWKQPSKLHPPMSSAPRAISSNRYGAMKWGPSTHADSCEFIDHPKLTGAGTPSIRQQRIHHDDIVAVLLELNDFDEIDCGAERSARRLGQTRLADPERSTVDTFKWDGKLPIAMKRGVRVLQLVASGTRRRVYPPARVLEVRCYTSQRGGSRAIVCIEMPKHARARNLSDVLAALGSRGRVLRGLKRPRRLVDPGLIYVLGRLWARRSRRSA